MKKFLITMFLFFSTSSTTFAKTTGNYFGADLIRSKIKFYEYATASYTPPSKTGLRFSHDHWSWGLNYKYAFNVADSMDGLGVKHRAPILDRLFLAPGLIFEVNNVKASKPSGPNRNHSLSVKNRYGVKLDFGYDLHPHFASYFSVGYVGIYYKTINATRPSDPGHTKIANLYDWFYGVGFKLDSNQDLVFNFEYNRERFKAKTSTDGFLNYSSLFITRFEVLKLGISYRF